MNGLALDDFRLSYVLHFIVFFSAFAFAKSKLRIFRVTLYTVNLVFY